MYPKAPDGGRQIVVNNLDPQFLGVSSTGDLTIAAPYQNYYVDLTNLASGQLLSVARVAHWMYPLLSGTNAAGAAELAADEKTGKTLEFVGLDKANFSNETMEALQKAEQLPQVQKQDYELRRLDCPSILFVAVWLHGKSDDIIIPLSPTFGRWQAYQSYSESEMLKLLEPEAKRKLKNPGFD